MKLVDVTLEVKVETPKAYLVTDGDQEVWLPKSQVEAEPIKGNVYEFTLPEWLAKEKGLI